jgi:MATE family multidrug resistance protein
VSNAYGERSVTKIRRAGFSAAGVAVLFMAIAATVFISLRTFLPSLYIDSQEVISLASVLLIVAALFQLSDGLQATYLGILRGLMDVKIPMVFTFLAYWILGIPAGYLLSFTFNLGAVGVWIGLLIGLTSIAIFLMVRFNKKSRSVL